MVASSACRDLVPGTTGVVAYFGCMCVRTCCTTGVAFSMAAWMGLLGGERAD